MSDIVTWHQDGSVCTITLNSPDTRNAISVEQSDALVAACERVNGDLSVGCVILAAAGEVFSAGGNIKDMHARRGHFAGSAAENRRYYLNGIQRVARALYGIEVPVIAAVNGPAMGAGFDMCLMADIRIASQKAMFAESFINLGLVSAAGGAWFLTRAVGPAIAAELAFTGDSIDAGRALALGVVSRVVEPDRLLPEAREIAGRIARHAPHSIRLNKRLFRESARADLSLALELAASFQGIVQHTEDQREAVAAVIEKRPAAFDGR